MLKLALKVLKKLKSDKVFVDTVKGLLFIFDCAMKTICIILKSYKVLIDFVKELFFIVDCAIKCSLYNTVNPFANLFIICSQVSALAQVFICIELASAH